jgi:hypothetical protein
VLDQDGQTATQVAAYNEGTAGILSAAVQELRRLGPSEAESPAEYAGRVPDELLQDLLSIAVRLFAAKRALDKVDAFGNNHVTATEVSIVATAMLEAVDLELFELTLWNGWGRA